MNRKGISPLIATILLIAITIVVGALITAWATTYISNQTTAVAGGGVACVYLGLNVPSCNLTASTDDQLVVVIENTGSGQITEIKATIEAVDGTKRTGNVTSDSGMSKLLSLGGQEASKAYINKPADLVNVNLSNPNTWKSITIWVYNPDCPEVKYTFTSDICTT